MSAHCTICEHPSIADINGQLAAGIQPATIARKFDLGSSAKRALYRHLHARHGLAVAPSPDLPHTVNGDALARNGESHQPILTDVRRIARSAHRHLKQALRDAETKDANGAITAACKAMELLGKVTGEIKSGANVAVSVSAEARVAMDAHAQASNIDTHECIEQAGSYLRAQLEAGDAHAIRTVLALVRMIPSADAVTEPQALTGELAPSSDGA